jgi:CRP-like cAMP-binding protein
MESKLKFLTDDDYNLLWEKAKIAIFQKNEVILSEGCYPQGIYLLRKGNVRIERTTSGSGVAIASLKPGDIFGGPMKLYKIGQPWQNEHFYCQ